MESISLKKRVGRPKGTTTKRVKQRKLTQADYDTALQTIKMQELALIQLDEYKKMAENNSDYWMERFNLLYEERTRVNYFVKGFVNDLKETFASGMHMTGSIMIEDINYNLDLLPRVMDNKFGVDIE